MKQLIFLFLLAPVLLSAQNAKRDSLWLPFKPFIGVWSGEGGGEPGKGRYDRTYQFVLNQRFRFVINPSILLQQSIRKVRFMKTLVILATIVIDGLLYSGSFMQKDLSINSGWTVYLRTKRQWFSSLSLSKTYLPDGVPKKHTTCLVMKSKKFLNWQNQKKHLQFIVG